MTRGHLHMTGVSGRQRSELQSYAAIKCAANPGTVRREAPECIRLAASLLLLCVGRLADLENLALATEDVLAALALIECLAGDDAVDFWRLLASSGLVTKRCSTGGRRRRKWRCA